MAGAWYPYASAHNLHNSEAGVREDKLNGGAYAYAGELARYIRCPSTIRVRVLENFGWSPPIESIKEMQSKRGEERDVFRRSWDNLVCRDSDAIDFRVPSLVGRLKESAAPKVEAPRHPAFMPMDIIGEIAQAFGFTASDLKGTAKHKMLTLARRTAMYALVKRGNSRAQVGRWLNKDHSTVVHALRLFDERATSDMRAIAARYIGRTN